MMKKQTFLALLLVLLLLLTACGGQTMETEQEQDAQPVDEPAEAEPAPEVSEPAPEEQEAAAPVTYFTAADMRDIDPLDPNLSFSQIDFSLQPHFTSTEGLHEYFLDCIANRCRSIVFSCDKSVQVEMDGGKFCEDYLVAWAIPKMQPGSAGKQYIIRVTYYPGDNVACAYLDGDTASLGPEELELYNAAVAWLEENITEDMSDYDKCVAIHDSLSGTVQYDTELLAALNTSFTFDWGITAYGAMINRDSICQGYADAFDMLTSMLGMNCIQIYGSGDGVPHNWNMIELDGQWYHVDCTFDDMFAGNDGTSAKAYLFASDSQMRRTHNWESDRYPNAGDDSLYYYTAQDLVVSGEEELASKVGEKLQAGGQVNVYVTHLTQKAVTDYVQSLGADFHTADYVNDFVLCAWIP